MWNVGLELLQGPLLRSGLGLGSSRRHGIVPVMGNGPTWARADRRSLRGAPYSVTRAVPSCTKQNLLNEEKNISLTLDTTT